MGDVYKKTIILCRTKKQCNTLYARFEQAGSGDLIGDFEGKTKQKTRDAITSAVGGVFFLDEAYSLLTGLQRGYGRGHVADE